MAELNVQPKKRGSILPWILLALGVLALIWFLTRNKDKDETRPADTAATTQGAATGTATADWNGVDFNAPRLNYEEVTNADINVRGNDRYAIYGLGENILFDEGKASIRPDAEANLKQIVASVDKRYNGGEVRVYGFTDAKGSAGYNQELAQQRADAVKAWLTGNGIAADRVSVNAIGEANPVASNATEEGRQQNRRVEMVARGKQ